MIFHRDFFYLDKKENQAIISKCFLNEYRNLSNKITTV